MIARPANRTRPTPRGARLVAGVQDRGDEETERDGQHADVGRILFELGLRDRVQAVILAYEAGIVRPGQSA